MGSPLSALLAASQGGGSPFGGGGPSPMGGGPDSISVNPADHPDHGDAGGDPTAALQQAITALHTFVESADDEQDRQVALQCYAKLQSILATEQKEKEAALGVTPQTKYLAKATGRGGS